MGVARTPGSRRSRPAHHSIRYTFITMVIVPVLCLVVFWGLAVALTPGGALVRQGLFSSGHRGLAEVAVQVGAGLIVVLTTAVLMSLFARRLTHEVSGLEMTARHLAEAELPRILANLRGEEPPSGAADAEFTPPVARITEIATAAAAIASLRQAAVAAATDEAGLRRGIAQVFVSLARRNQSLLQRQLHLIDTLEQKATDPNELAELFSLDHLTTRMRRHAENLIVLSGASPGRSWSQPVPVIDVVRAAMAEVEDYQRVRVLSQSKDAVIGSAAADLIHLLAELIENATLFSPSDTEVEVRAERVTNGFVVEIEDRGLGIQPDLLSEINQKLLRPLDFTVAEPDRLGLFVVGRLAARHGARVSLSESRHGGTTAVVLVPANVLVEPAALKGEGGTDGRSAASASGEMPVIRTQRKPAGLPRRSRDAFALMPRRTAPPAPAQQSAVQPPTAPPLVVPPLAAATPPAATPPAAMPPAGRPEEPAEAFPEPTVLDGAARPRRAQVPLPRRGDRTPATGALADRAPVDRAPVDRAPVDRAPVDRAPVDRAPAAGDTLGSGTHRGLPRRVRQASLSPHLKDRGPADSHPPRSPTPAVPTPAAPTVAERTPEAARDLVAAFRAGWRREMAGQAPGVTLASEKSLTTAGPESSQPQPSQPQPSQPQRRPDRPGSELPAPQEPSRGQGTPGSPPSATGPQTARPTAAPQGEETQWKSGARQEPEQT
jgi:signal transduction histidine kinase